MKWLVIIAGLVVAGCASTTEKTRTEGTHPPEEDLRKYESDFRPSDHDPAVAVRHTTRDTARSVQDTEGNASDSLPEEYVSGYRVQIFVSTNIDAAKQKKGEAEALFPHEWFYLEYDAPTYKVRAGNFLQRYEAERFARLAGEQGFKDSWPVPERVLKNPPIPSR
jgi:hypothetical protein